MTYNLDAELSLSTTDFKANVTTINREMRKVTAEFRASTASMDSWSNSSDGLEQHIDSLNKKIPLQEKAIENLNKEYQAMVDAGEQNSTTAKNLEIRILKYTETLGKMQKELRQSEEMQANLGKEQDDGRKKTVRLKDALHGMTGVLKRVGPAAAGAASGIGRMASNAVKATARVAAGAARMGAAVAVAMGVLAASTIGPASDFSETLSKTAEVFGTMTDQVVVNANAAVGALGISRTAYMDYASAIGAAMTAGGMGIEDATALSERAVQHFADLASFHNKEVDDVADSWQSAIRGSYEPIQKYFPFITNEYLKTYGTAQGLIDQNTSTLTANQRAIILNAIALDKELNPAMGDFAKTSGGLANLGRFFSGFTTNLRAQIGGAIVPLLETAGGALRNLFLSEGFDTGLTNFIAGLESLLAPLNGLTNYFAFVVEEGDYLNDFLMDIPESIRGLVESIGRLMSGDMNFGDFITNMFSSFNLGEMVGNLLGGMLSRKAEFLQIGVTIITTLLAGITQAIPELQPVVMQILETLISFITETAPLLIESGIPLILSLVTGLLEALPMILQAAAEIIIALALGIAEALPELIPTIVEVLIQIVQVLIDNLPMLIEAALVLITALSDGIIAAMPVLIAALPPLIVAFVQALLKIIPLLLKAALQIIAALAGALLENMPLILQAIWDIIDGVITTFGEWLPTVPDIGRDIVDGVWDGIKNSASVFYANIRRFFKNAIDEVKEALGINSPSLVFANVVGRAIPEGVGVGIAKGMPNLQRDLSNSMRSLTSGLNLSMQAPTMGGFAPAFAGAGAAAVGGAQNVIYEGDTHLHVGTLVADDAGLAKLERQLRPHRARENQRRSG